ncbi:TlpA disulfide reductase family protein [Pedobacter jejuensis]|uniref:AhpC/TSA family protein n=1 Tax=Pedobacter jejuensis TaxID=1268550 RepID=A0A3N0BQQ7_9SPHI|nr:TlpA disulfide reductase family protein [Pedobacter jejuensis]RNL51349.1 AhpC/TSA family protein [Pedobacter jejuensis]
MKYIRFLMIAAVATIYSQMLYAQANTYVINGKIDELNIPAKAYLNYKSAAGWQMDSTLIKQGKFSFSGTVPNDQQATLFVNKSGSGVRSRNTVSFILYLEPGNINVVSPDSVGNAVISGGPLNTDNARLTALMSTVNKKVNMMISDYQKATKEVKATREFNDKMEKTRDSISREQNSVNYSFIKGNPNSLISLFALQNYAGSFPDVNQLETIFNSLSKNVQSSELGKDYAAEIARMKTTEIGAIAPDFTQADTSGKAISLHDFKGKYVLLDFWASWCGPCRAENPNVVAAYNKYKGSGFTVVGISLDQQGAKDKWLNAIHNDHLTWTQLSDLKSWKNQVAMLYSVQAIPQNFLIDPDGKIVGKNLQGQDLNNKLQEIFKK